MTLTPHKVLQWPNRGDVQQKRVRAWRRTNGLRPTAEAPWFATEARSVGRREKEMCDDFENGLAWRVSRSILTLATVAYLAIQIRQNTAQQKRKELISIQHGQNSVVAQLQDPGVFGAFVRGAAGHDSSIEDRAIADDRRTTSRRRESPASNREEVDHMESGRLGVRRARVGVLVPSRRRRAAQQGLATDNRQLGVPESGSILASGLCDIALTVSAVCCN